MTRKVLLDANLLIAAFDTNGTTSTDIAKIAGLHTAYQQAIAS